MRLFRMAVALTFVLGTGPAAYAGRVKSTKTAAAHKAGSAAKRSARAVPAMPQAPDGECTRVILDDVPFSELRLVGIVGHGRTRKAVLMDASDDANTLTPSECVGVERVPYEDVVKALRKRLANR